MKSFHLYRQYDAMDCGPTCLRMVAKHHGRSYSMDSLRRMSGINREGVSLPGTSEAAEEIGFLQVGIKCAQTTKTPTIFLNGYELPIAYRMKDLPALVPGLTDAFANNNSLNVKKVLSTFWKCKNIREINKCFEQSNRGYLFPVPRRVAKRVNLNEDKTMQILNRNQMKSIMAGSGGCRVAWRNADGSFAGYSACTTMDPSDINLHFENEFTNDSGQYVSGYCCASCGTGNFSNASPCP